MHPKIRKGITAVTDFINRPIVRGVSKLSANILNTMFLIKDSHPISLVAGGASLVNSLAESFDLPKVSPLDSYIRSHNLIPSMGTLSRLVYMSDYFKDCEKNYVFSSEDENLIEIVVDEKNKLYIVEYENQHVTLGADRGQKVSDEFFFTPNFDFENLFDKIWEYYQHGIYLKRHKHNFSLELRALPAKPMIYIGEHDPAAFYTKLKKSLDANISRSYLFNGYAGTGKSSFAMKIASENFKRIVKIDPAMARSLDVGELEFFVEQIRPNVLIFDDFDRAYTSADVALSMLENLKQAFPQLVIFATVNSIEKLDKALLRPGRFDQILFFGYPNEEHRKQILGLYFQEFSRALSDELLEEVCIASKKLTPAYLKELAIESRNIFEEDFRKELLILIEEFAKRSAYEALATESPSNELEPATSDNLTPSDINYLQKELTDAEWEELEMELSDSDEDFE